MVIVSVDMSTGVDVRLTVLIEVLLFVCSLGVIQSKIKSTKGHTWRCCLVATCACMLAMMRGAVAGATHVVYVAGSTAHGPASCGQHGLSATTRHLDYCDCVCVVVHV